MIYLTISYNNDTDEKESVWPSQTAIIRDGLKRKCGTNSFVKCLERWKVMNIPA